MKKLFLILSILILTANLGYSQVTTLWQKSVANSNNPGWNSASLVRGLAYGQIGANHRLFVASRSADHGGKQIIIFNAVTGDSVGLLDTTGLAGGTAVISDVEVSSDGRIFVCNLAVGGFFKVYRYDTEASAPVTVINYDATGMRLGDKITITGSTADNSIIIWAVSADADGEVLKFTTTDNGMTFTPTILDVGTFATFASAAVGPLPNGDFYYNAHGSNTLKYSSTGTLLGTIPPAVQPVGGSAVRFLKSIAGDEYIVANALGGPTFENARIIKVPGGVLANATLYASTPNLGGISAGGLGDVAFRKINDFVYHVYPLSTNNGFGAYQVVIEGPSLAGTYYIGNPGTAPGGTDPHFLSIREAFSVLNEATFSGDCTFLITSNLHEPFPSPAPVGDYYGLGLAIDPSPFTVTFKPYTGVQPVITLAYPVDGTSGPSGAMVFGVPTKGNIAWDSLTVTRNIVFDGSNTVGGTTRDLTIENMTTSHGNAFTVTIVGDVSNVTFKNCNIYYKAQSVSTSNLFRAAVQLRGRLQGGIDWTPTNITFDNNHISSNFPGVSQGAQGIVVTALAPTPVSTYASGIVIKNNKIEGTQRAVALNWSGNTDIFDNEIVLNQTVAATSANQGIVAVNVVTGSEVNIYNNIVSQISSLSNGATAGNTGISIESNGTYNVYNNMIFGFGLTSTNPTAFLRGIQVSSSTATANVYYNSVYMDNIGSIGTGTVTYSGLFFSNGTNTVKNNIVYSAETDFASYCINRTGTSGTLESNYNNFYPVSGTNGNVGYWNNAATQTLANWQAASSQDANSKSKQVFFVSNTNLHLTGSSDGDFDLAGTPITGITTDIDGDTRHAIYPYMGCDEASIPLPVEFVSFSASVISGEVHLKWSTATETNNRGFEVQRSNGSDFITIGFVQGAGTTTEARSYNFVDNSAATGVNSYRLKQVDLDGSYSYSSIIEVDVTTPLSFNLSQNYPNPFNPTTTINYEIANPVNVSLIVYSILGEQVLVLVDNQFTEPGVHSVYFDASNLASGTYIYRIQAGEFVQTKKMILTK